MSTLNAWVIQEALKQEKKITIAWLQHTFSVSYLQAREILAELESRGWVFRSADRRSWRVMTRNLFLRRLDLSETEALCEALTTDCLSALERLQQADGMGVSHKELEMAVRGETDTREAIRALTKLKLIFRSQKMLYYSRISERESRALVAAVRQRLRNESARGHRDEEKELAEFRQLLWQAIQDATGEDDEE